MVIDEIVIWCFIFAVGAMVGSFLNVCIHRMPRDLSIVWPRSFCPHCRAKIPWYRNVPILTFLLQSGKCARCQRRISSRYFLVELLTAVTWLLLWIAYGPSAQFAISIIFISMMIVITVTDLETGLIPDQITIPGMLLGLSLSFVNTGAFPDGLWYHKLLASLIGLLGGGAVIWVTGWLGGLIFRKEAMGGGDVKLLAMTGAFIGFEKTLLVFFLSPFIALPYALFHRFIKKNETIPYGPFLAVIAVLVFLKGDAVINFLMRLYGV